MIKHSNEAHFNDNKILLHNLNYTIYKRKNES